MSWQDEERIETEKIGEGSVRTSRVERRCGRCPLPIKPGQRYERQPWKIDGEMWVETNHANYRDCDPFYGE